MSARLTLALALCFVVGCSKEPNKKPRAAFESFEETYERVATVSQSGGQPSQPVPRQPAHESTGLLGVAAVVGIVSACLLVYFVVTRKLAQGS